jgi:uncharacterized protein YneF (UPF0154 family)
MEAVLLVIAALLVGFFGGRALLWRDVNRVLRADKSRGEGRR